MGRSVHRFQVEDWDRPQCVLDRANRYFVLQWNFSKVHPEGDVDRIAESLRLHVASQAKTFAARYADHLPGPVEVEGPCESILDSILRVVEQTPYGLYLLIDEYDNFVNDVMVEDVDTYHALFAKGGPYKQLRGDSRRGRRCRRRGRARLQPDQRALLPQAPPPPRIPATAAP